MLGLGEDAEEEEEEEEEVEMEVEEEGGGVGDEEVEGRGGREGCWLGMDGMAAVLCVACAEGGSGGDCWGGAKWQHLMSPHGVSLLRPTWRILPSQTTAQGM